MIRRLPEETLGQRIGRLRSKHGWTQQQLADRIAASRVAISHFEIGLALPSERTLILLAGLFRLEPHELIADTQYPEAKADKLPAVAPRYTEVELQLALCKRDLFWATRVGDNVVAETRIQWQTQLGALLDNATDLAERLLLRAALADLCA